MNELPEVLDERKADAAAIQSLRNEIRRLTPMSLLKLEDGRVVAVPAYDEVTKEDLQARRDKLAGEVAEIDKLLGNLPAPVKPSDPAPTAPESAESGNLPPAPHQDSNSGVPVQPSGQPVDVQPQVTPLAGQLPQAAEAPAAPVAPTTDPIQ